MSCFFSPLFPPGFRSAFVPCLQSVCAYVNGGFVIVFRFVLTAPNQHDITPQEGVQTTNDATLVSLISI